MFIVESYAVAIIMCFITMICWGSWANTTKLVSNKKWEFPLFYWDYSIGLLLCSLLFAFTHWYALSFVLSSGVAR
jgi:glucose uptake protein